MGGGEGKRLVTLVSTSSAAALKMGRYVMIVFRGEFRSITSVLERGELVVLFVQTQRVKEKTCYARLRLLMLSRTSDAKLRTSDAKLRTAACRQHRRRLI